jgi:hypothetical protein
MERRIVTVAATAALAFAAGALAQQQTPEHAAPPSQTQQIAVPVSDSDLEKFADIYVELEKTAAKFEPQLDAAKSESEAQEVNSRMQKESTETVSQHGWTPERYLLVADAINSDRNLAEKTLQLISQRR